MKAEILDNYGDVDTLLGTHHTKVAHKSRTHAGVAELADALDLGSCATVQTPSCHHANSVTEGFLMRCGCLTDNSHLPCEYALDETFNETSPQPPTVACGAVAYRDPTGPAAPHSVRALRSSSRRNVHRNRPEALFDGKKWGCPARNQVLWRPRGLPH